MTSLKGFFSAKFPEYLKNYSEELNLFTHWNWNYEKYLYFLNELLPWIRENPKWKLSILTSHPHCFTNGSGLQKEKGQAISELVDFDQSIKLPFPLHQIKRGGGLTFHYPGQMIYYPILNMNHIKLSPPRIMLKMIQIAKEVLEEKLNISELDYQKLLGLWYQEKTKIASVGMGLEYYVSIHGMAFNYNYDEKMFQALRQLHPCGLQGDIYNSLDKIQSIESLSREQFSQIFHQKFSEWIRSRK